MSWTDSQSIKVINYLKNKTGIRSFIETGSYKGINARLHSKNFENVITCEKVDEYYKIAKRRLKKYENVIIEKKDSPEFLKMLPSLSFIFYLDAHFYDPNLPEGRGKFVVLRELENMTKFKNSIIIIHDFHNGLGGITYDGIDLDMNLIETRLENINKHFYFYTNTLEGCDIVKPTKKAILEAGLVYDKDTIGNLKLAWTKPRLTYRGILYCLPFKLEKEELKKLGLRKWN